MTLTPAERIGGRLHLPVQAAFPLANAGDAHREVEIVHVRGKVVLVATAESPEPPPAAAGGVSNKEN